MTFSPAPPFRPAPFLRSGHAQTLAGVYLPPGQVPNPAFTRQHVVTLADGDAVVLHEDRPSEWQPGNRAAVLVHGLAGSYQSGYMGRVARRLNDVGICTFRFDMRGCGAAYRLAQHPAHSARTTDLIAALAVIQERCPGSPVAAIGFSLGGNLLLNTLAELSQGDGFPLDRAIAVCPPIDLVACSGFLKSGRWRIYDRHFISTLLQTLADRQQTFPEATPVTLARRPTSLWDFDHVVTAPLCGYASAEAYYQATSPVPRLPEIGIPTLIVAAENDPLIPIEMFHRIVPSSALSVQITSGGGHLGFISSGGRDQDRRWLDWRLVEWMQAAETQSGQKTPGMEHNLATG